MIFEIENYPSLHQSVEELCACLLQQGLPSESVFDCKLVAYELLGNVLKHGDGKAKLQANIVNGFVELKIYTNAVFVLPKEKACPDATAEHGRGLFLVNEVCEERFYSDEDGIRVQIRIKKD